ncbi:biopolymer transporter protein ExbD [Marinobacterium nitratireducens]|uniref:Biopolymer transporter protein ExbD n=1 Tax=Marinobacterium nitratireducens TaxID=518897 RepID=A0A918DV92_9GAMM|nr:biopolymer transporter ExbD [Marinobacterium nitratireducens]GGO84822.1 biopolymer transporter protein ExbD [Marinobacterium nitratireducens]
MKFSPTHSRRINSGDDNLIPLINVVFLMLIFFMVAGQISRSDAISVMPPASLSEKRSKDDNRALVLISVQEGLFVDERPVSLEGIREALMLRFDNAENPDDFSVLVKADADTPVDQLQAVLKQIRAAGLMKVALATRLQGASV